MSEELDLPRGGVDLRKYAAMSFALALARGALMNALSGDIDDAQKILEITGTSKIAEALRCAEDELAIDWNECLTPNEVSRVKGGG